MKIAAATFYSLLAVLAAARPCWAGAPAAQSLDDHRDPQADHASMVPTPAAGYSRSGSAKEPPALRFRRVYVPEGTTDWLKGNVRYLPMAPAEFDRLLGASQRTTPELPAHADAGLVRAEYECRLKGQSVLQGSGTLDVSGAISSTTFLTLDPCNLAIDRARWVTSDGAPAVLGASSDGRVQVLAERGGQMKFDWSLSGQEDASNGTSFAISLPPSPVSRMRLELPAEVSPTVDRGVIAAARAAKPAEPGFRCWDIELGGCAGCRLRLAKQGGDAGGGTMLAWSARGSPQVVLADESAVYDLSLRGIDVAMELEIGNHRGQLPSVALELDPPLQLVGIAAGHPAGGHALGRSQVAEGLQPLPTHSVGAPNPTAKPRDKRQCVVVEIPPALQEGALKLHIRAVAALPMDELWKLPRLFVEEVVCRSNRIRLTVSPPICIASLSPHGCRQTGMAALKSGYPLAGVPGQWVGGEQLDFDLCEADASLELSLTRPLPEIRAVCATNTEIGQGKMNSRVAADFRTSEGPVFDVEADVLPSWTIDSVASQPADAVDDWPPPRGARRKLIVHLARPLTPLRPLRLIVSAHRLYAGSGRNQGVKLTIDDVVPLRFAAAPASRPLIDIRAGGPSELHVTGGGAFTGEAPSGSPGHGVTTEWVGSGSGRGGPPWRVDVRELTPAELDLCGYAQGDVLLRDDAAAAALRLSLTRRGPAYTADIRVEAVVARETLEESYHILCTPATATPIDRLVVYFSGRGFAADPLRKNPVPPEPLTWSVNGLDDTRFTARRWTQAQESAAGLSADQEAWDVTFGNRPAAPIELHAARKTKLAGPLPLCLVSLPDAAAQQAAVIVRSLGPQALQIAARRVIPLPIEAAPPGQIQTLRGAWRYDARTETAPHAEPAVVLTLADRAAPSAWAWDGAIRSRFAANGRVEHLLTYDIENTGARQIFLELRPASGCPPLHRADVHDISINGKLASTSSAEAAADALPIDLPPDVRFVRLALCVSTSGAPLATLQRLQPPLLDIGVPVFARHWTVDLPPGYSTLGGSSDSESYGLRQRLLNGLARGDQQGVFDPFRGGDWQKLLPLASPNPPGDSESAVHQPGGESSGGDANDLQETLGWSRCGIEIGDAERVGSRWPASVVVVHRPALAVAGWMLFLAIVAVGAWPRTGRPTVMIALAAVCGVCALLLPAELAGVFSKGLLGIGFCVVLTIARRRPATAGGAPTGGEPSGSPGHGAPTQWAGSGSGREGPPATTTAEMPSTISNFVPYAAPVLAAVVLCLAQPSAAAEPPADAPACSVFVPVDGKQQPTGGKYLVPEAFYSELYHRAARHAETPQGWIISSAVYRAVLAEDVAGTDAQQWSSEHVVDHLTADYGIRVFNAAARVRLPLRREEVSLVPDQALLDERPVQPEWESDGAALVLEIAEPGEYHLELTLRPNVRPESRAGGFDLAIPRVPGARLEVNVPMGGPAVTVPSALGAVHWEEIPSRWIAELGPAGRLAVRWHDGTADAGEAADVQQLQWLRIEPGCVLLNVRLKAKVAAGQLRKLQVKADSSLELLPDPTNNVRQVSAPGHPLAGRDATQTLEFQLPAAGAGSDGAPAGAPAQRVGSRGSATLDLRFLCTAAASIGTFRAPQIEVVGARPGRTWLAVSIDPSLEYQLPAGAPGAPAPRVGSGSPSDVAAVTEFIANWGGAPEDSREQGARSKETELPFSLLPPPRSPPTIPEAAFHFNGNASQWSMTTRARKTETSGDVRTQWSFDAGNAQLQFEASLTTVGGSAFQYCLELPSELRVDSLAVTNDGTAVPARWIRSQDGRLTVFLARPAGDGAPAGAPAERVGSRAPLGTSGRLAGPGGRQRLQLRGQLPVPLKGKVSLPQVRLDDVHVQSAAVRIFRRDTVAVEVLAPPAGHPRSGSAENKTPAEDVGPDELGQPVRAFYVDPAGTTALSVALQPAPEPVRDGAGRAAAPAAPPVPSPGAVTRVVSADVRYAWRSGGRCVAAAALEVESPGYPGHPLADRGSAADYPLQIPAGFELTHLAVDGVPVDVAPAPHGRYILSLSPNSARSRVELLFIGPADTSVPAGNPLAGGAGRMTFAAPRLGDLHVERTSWTIAAPPGLQLGPGEADGDLVLPTAADDADSDAQRWSASGLLSQWRQLASNGGNVVTYALNRRADAIAVNIAAAPSKDWLARWASAAGFLTVMALMAFLLRPASGCPSLLADWLVRWPHACGIALGLAWWLWASPSALGLAIVFAILAHQILVGYRLRRPFADRAGHPLAGRGAA